MTIYDIARACDVSIATVSRVLNGSNKVRPLTRAKVLAGLDPDTKVRVLNYPGSSWLDMLRPKPSSQPAAASLPQAVGGLLGQSVLSILDQAERTVTGANALWLGEHRF